MAQTFAVPLDIGAANTSVFNDISNALATLRSSFSGTVAPTSPVAGNLWWDTTGPTMKVYNGSAWVALGSVDGD
jgi:hypothetical protein